MKKEKTMKVDLDAQLVYSVLFEAFEVMDKDEFAGKVEEVYAECAEIIARRLITQLSLPDCPDADIVEETATSNDTIQIELGLK